MPNLIVMAAAFATGARHGMVAGRARAVEIDLHFERPFPADADIRFDLVPQPEGERTLVTWSMAGEHTGVMRVLGRVLSMDRLVGTDLETGLARLKDLVER